MSKEMGFRGEIEATNELDRIDSVELLFGGGGHGMRFGRVVSWEHDVLAAWQLASRNAPCPNSDVWGKLPEHVCWLSACVEEIDIPRLYVIGSGDWEEVFGTYRLEAIAATPLTDTYDKYQHSSRIVGIGSAYSVGSHFEPIVMVSFSGEGPFVILDGNHRGVAMHRVGLLVGREVFVGLHSDIGTEFCWFRQAVSGYQRPAAPGTSPAE